MVISGDKNKKKGPKDIKEGLNKIYFIADLTVFFNENKARITSEVERSVSINEATFFS
jgi:hypothetical protein